MRLKRYISIIIVIVMIFTVYVTSASAKGNESIYFNAVGKTAVLGIGSTIDIHVKIEMESIKGLDLMYRINDASICSCKWGEWNGEYIPITVTGKQAGNARIQLIVGEDQRIVDTMLLTVIPFSNYNAANISPDTFQFRSIPWGANFADVNNQLGLQKRDWAYMEDTPEISVLDRVLRIYGSDKYDEEIGKYWWTTSPDDITVAGHKLTSIWLYFAYDIDSSGKVVRNDDNTKLYYAYYSLLVRDLDNDYQDIKNKLVDLYGNPTDSGSIDTPLVSSLFCDIWISADSTLLCLEKGYNILDEPVIYIAYASLEGNEWLSDAYEAVLSEEKTNQQNNTDGL